MKKRAETDFPGKSNLTVGRQTEEKEFFDDECEEKDARYILHIMAHERWFQSGLVDDAGVTSMQW